MLLRDGCLHLRRTSNLQDQQTFGPFIGLGLSLRLPHGVCLRTRRAVGSLQERRRDNLLSLYHPDQGHGGASLLNLSRTRSNLRSRFQR